MGKTDLISRAEAMGVFMGKPPEYYHTSYIVGELNCVPAVDAVPVVHAHWVEEPDRINHWHCSNCGCPVGLASLAYRYCYVCGAKMDGERRDEDGSADRR